MIPDSSDRRIRGGQGAMQVLDQLDDELLGRFDQVTAPMWAYGELMARRGMDPALVLGQMVQVAVQVFTDQIMPNYTQRPES